MLRHSVPIRFDRLADAGRNRPLLVMIETADGAEHEDIMFTEINPTPDRIRQTVQTSWQSQRPESMSGSGYLKFRNDRGVPEIRIGVWEFKCIGESPPQDHPHVYINMGEADTILCPYCGTRFRFDPRLTPLDAEPPDSLFADQNAA
jgi:uncharacterized Zn-finger protein